MNTGNGRTVEYCSFVEACRQMQRGSDLLFPALKSEILSILDSLNQYNKRDHLYRQYDFTICKTGIVGSLIKIIFAYETFALSF